MSDSNQHESTSSGEGAILEPGFLHSEQDPGNRAPLPSSQQAQPEIISPVQNAERIGTIEHLAARVPVTEPDTNAPAIKQQLSVLRANSTRLVTGLRWEGLSVQQTARRFIPLLNIGPVEQWKHILIPLLYEIDRAGALIPVWLHIIKRGDPPDLAANENPAETESGRARRFAILMLGNYRMMGIASPGRVARALRPSSTAASHDDQDVVEILGDLAIDPQTSLYATQALVQQATVPAIQELLRALKYAKNWARVDVVTSCLALQQPQFHELLVAKSLHALSGLESYITTPLYRNISLEPYLTAEATTDPILIQQAALIFSQVLQDSTTPPTTFTEKSSLPPVFDRPLPALAQALFQGTRRQPMWQNTVALHRLALLLGRYWDEMSQGRLKDPRILEPIYHTVPLMNEIERWMRTEGRDTLLRALSTVADEHLTLVVRTIGEIRDTRAVAPLMNRLESIQKVENRQQALRIGTLCETLGQLGDPGAIHTLHALIRQTIDLASRRTHTRRRDNLPLTDPDVPGSIIYAAVIRACGQLGNRDALDFIYPASNDFDPYVRLQALEAIKRLDPQGTDLRSQSTARELLQDPRESVVRNAIQLLVHFHNSDAISLLEQLQETRPEIAHLTQDALHQLKQPAHR